MGDAIFSFMKPNFHSTVASARIASFLGEVLNLPIYHNADIKNVKADRLIIVNGAFAFCSCLEELAVAIFAAKHIVWVQNDYNIFIPKNDNNATSPFRVAFRKRVQKGKSRNIVWSTVEKLADTYINWNSLTYEPLPEDEVLALKKKAPKDLFYYGAFRTGRVKAFTRYFIDCPLPVTISTTTYKFGARYTDATIVPGMKRDAFYQGLCAHGLGLYLEDEKSHREFHSPANRFYEMLSAGLPMVFQPEATPMMEKAGYDIRKYVINDPADLVSFMRKREQARKEQAALWGRDYRKELTKVIKKAYKGLPT